MFIVVKLEHREESGIISDEWMSVVGYDIGETYICFECGTRGFPSSLAIAFGDDVRSMTAEQLVGEMDIRDTYANVPECGCCGDKLIDERRYRLESYEHSA
jgi:hypothetical protein